MSNRFSRSPDPRADLFSSYNRSASPSKSKNKPPRSSPYGTPGGGSGYGFAPPNTSTDHLAPNGNNTGAPAFNAYPSANGGGGTPSAHFRAATPNSRGQYSAAVLDELESQNDEQVGVLSGKVRMLKDLTVAIGDEIRDSSSLADRMNDQFENSRLKIRGTMNRMLRMAEKTGVGWRVWLGFFAAVIFLFWYVWLF
ncbi:hypothetical protein BU26DRAFT_543439 [Trematosphaeria pertusa]|uniref:t-SNARE coiled-coil homology domain-containing protein n=1 Tax=Trematosphaeria pertusa TaxID=390896 RepID=A0A6A6HYF5_9PLEO|nr:uncharacterized protein BU26DRAFT_543439 [Trematosphaeria pertusa]KAF2243264.1 hypothetical protein BU26DRAFT_543439 [Trematosphaeria pertusa]